jgi:DNA-directed RNA polymerase specialized sigma24 family protein
MSEQQTSPRLVQGRFRLQDIDHRILPEDGRRATDHIVGDSEVLENLWRDCYPQLTHFLSLVIPDEPIDEICIDVFAMAWGRAARSPRSHPTLTGIFRIAFHEATLRNLARQTADSLADGGARLPANLTCNSSAASPYGTRRALGTLSWEARVVAALVYGMGFSRETIRQITSMTNQEVGEHLSTALCRLRISTSFSSNRHQKARRD